MRAPYEAVHSYLSRGDMPETTAVLDGDALHTLAERVATESGVPLDRDAVAVKYDCSVKAVAAFIFAIAAFCVVMILRDVWVNDAYPGNPHMLVPLAILFVVISVIASYAVLHSGFSDRWLIMEKNGARFRIRRFVRYRVEDFPYASIGEIAMDTYPTKRGEMFRLAVTRDAQVFELLRIYGGEAEEGVIPWTAGLLGAASGVPVTRRKFPSFSLVARKRRKKRME